MSEPVWSAHDNILNHLVGVCLRADVFRVLEAHRNANPCLFTEEVAY